MGDPFIRRGRQGAYRGSHRPSVTQEETEKGGAPRAETQHTRGCLCLHLAASEGRYSRGGAVQRRQVADAEHRDRRARTGRKFSMQAGKRGVPAGGWPEGSYSAKVTITRDGKTLIEQSSKPVAFE